MSVQCIRALNAEKYFISYKPKAITAEEHIRLPLHSAKNSCAI